MRIKFIYFDVGGVAMLDFSKTNKWALLLKDLGIKENDFKKFNALYDEEEPKYCVGEKDMDSFVEILRNEFGLQLAPEFSLLDDLISRFEPNTELAKIIDSVKDEYRIGLLTNMYPRMLQSLNSAKLLPKINWEVIVDSSVVGFRKPQPEIFEIAQARAKVQAEEILYIENTQTHIDVAKALGWNTILYDPSDITNSNKLILETLDATI